MKTKRDIEKLALTDPIVRAYLDSYRYGRGIKWDEMMCALVASLVEVKDAAQAQMLDMLNRMPTQTLVMPSQIERSRLDVVASDGCKVGLETMQPNTRI